MILDFAVITWKNFKRLIVKEKLVTSDDVRMSNARTPTAHTHPSGDLSDIDMLDRILTNGNDVLVHSDGHVLWK